MIYIVKWRKEKENTKRKKERRKDAERKKKERRSMTDILNFLLKFKKQRFLRLNTEPISSIKEKQMTVTLLLIVSAIFSYTCVYISVKVYMCMLYVRLHINLQEVKLNGQYPLILSRPWKERNTEELFQTREEMKSKWNVGFEIGSWKKQ